MLLIANCDNNFSPVRHCRLTLKRSLRPFALVQEGADGLRRGVAQDGVQHLLAEPADHRLALILVGVGQNPADLLQQVDHGLLRRVEEENGGMRVGISHQ